MSSGQQGQFRSKVNYRKGIYNSFYNIKKKDETKTKNIYNKNKMETKMDLLKNYIPKMNNKEIKISDYFNG